MREKEMNKLKLLNLGCGDHYHKDWVNVDFIKTGPDVIEHNLLTGIPYPDNSFDVVYHSHVLEHFSKNDGALFIKECYRVLKPGGILRIAIPDLEAIVDLYKENLKLALTGDENAYQNYQWLMLELYDQTTRSAGGGEMKKYLKQEHLPNEEFVKSRVGSFYDEFRVKPPLLTPSTTSKVKHFIKKIIPVSKIKNLSSRIGDTLFNLNYKRIGKFRLSGEIHQWMYDRMSLGRLLTENGFKKPQLKKAIESQIPSWNNYGLDADVKGRIYKLDSLYMEAIKLHN